MTAERTDGARPPGWLTWGQVLRVSLFGTAAADALAGFVLARGVSGAAVDLEVLPLLVLVSLGLYHGGMALNDWADREEDLRVGRDRPLPRGLVAPSAVLAVALGLLAGAVALAFALGASVGLGALALGVLVVLYDLIGRGDLLGPLLLGACRALNLSLPLLAVGAPAELPLEVWSAPALYAGYVFTLSRLGRYEDGAASPLPLETPARLVRLLALLLPCVALLPVTGVTWPGRALALALGLAGARGLCGAAGGLARWEPGDIPPVMGLALRRMLLVTGAIVSLQPLPLGLPVLAGFLVLYRVSWRLRQVFPPS